MIASRRAGHDPLEGISAGGLITTGVSRRRVPAAFEPVVAAAVDTLVSADAQAAVHLYGSVATGEALVPVSDVDLLTLDVPEAVAADIGSALSRRFSSVCRGVDVAAAHTADVLAATDESYGLRLFLRHYCVHLAGPPHVDPVEGYAPDRRAARGLNGDIGIHAARWRAALETGADAPAVARRVSRKTLLAVGGLVSMHDHGWTTDRAFAARRWAEIDPTRTAGLAALATWVHDATAATHDDVLDALDHTVDPIVDAFADTIGLWG